MSKSTEPQVERLGLSVKEFCKASGLGQTYVYGQIRAGNLRVRKFGTRTILSPDEARRFMSGRPMEAE